MKQPPSKEWLTERAAIASAYWLDASPHERTEEDGIYLAMYARQAMKEIQELKEYIATVVNHYHHVLTYDLTQEGMRLVKGIEVLPQAIDPTE